MKALIRVIAIFLCLFTLIFWLIIGHAALHEADPLGLLERVRIEKVEK